MILLDTNVISEAMEPAPHPSVQHWLDNQIAETLYLSSVTLAELLFGIAALAGGKRKNMLAQALDGMTDLFRDRILSFDARAAQCYAALAVTARQNGRGFPLPDGYIAAIAASRNFTVASRDSAPYMAANVPLINPWTAA